MERNKDKIKVKHAENRFAVLSHYSKGTPRCACCGETEVKFLGIDHINGNGSKERKTLRRGDTATYLRTSGLPDGYQVLCHNCNLAKGFYGVCPHQDGVTSIARKS